MRRARAVPVPRALVAASTAATAAAAERPASEASGSAFGLPLRLGHAALEASRLGGEVVRVASEAVPVPRPAISTSTVAATTAAVAVAAVAASTVAWCILRLLITTTTVSAHEYMFVEFD